MAGHRRPCRDGRPGRTAGIAQRRHPAGVIRVDFARNADPEFDADLDDEPRTAPAEVTAQVNLNSSRSDVETFHVELSLDGSALSYEPGDSIGFVPENDPALVEDVMRAAGLSGRRAAGRGPGPPAGHHHPDPRADRPVRHADRRSRAARPGGRSRTRHDFLRDRQFIDLLEAAPQRLEPDQLVSLLRPLPPRLYSVASSQAAVGEEAHLLVARVQWESHGRTRSGVASNQVADRLGVGASLPVHVKRNPHFRLPADESAPVIMIGPGTGVAPFRAFLQQREATGASGRNWLFFGARRFTHDFLYQLEWQDWLASGVLQRIELAFSRDQANKVYVQHRMWEARRDLFAWLQDGAHLYVCGDAKAMAKDVHAMLLRVIADQGGHDADGATAYLRGLQQDGRYRRDVY